MNTTKFAYGMSVIGALLALILIGVTVCHYKGPETADLPEASSAAPAPAPSPPAAAPSTPKSTVTDRYKGPFPAPDPNSGMAPHSDAPAPAQPMEHHQPAGGGDVGGSPG